MRKRPKHEPTDFYFYLARQLAKCMVRSDAFNSHVYPVITEMTVMQQILISHIFYSYEIESKEILSGGNLSQVCYTDEGKSEIVIVNESSTEEIESKSAHKSISTNKETDSIDEI